MTEKSCGLCKHFNHEKQNKLLSWVYHCELLDKDRSIAAETCRDYEEVKQE